MTREPRVVLARALTRCTSYQRARGIFIYSRARCELLAGHTGQHFRAGSFLDPRASHRWGHNKEGN